MFYAKSTGGFYDESIHGHRRIRMIDPEFVWPQIEVENPHFDPESSVDGPTIFIDDPEVIPPVVEIDNPACKIPADATDESLWDYTYAELLAGQTEGKRIVSDDYGCPILADQEPLTPAELAAQVRSERDRLLQSTAWLVERHQEQLIAGIDSALCDADYRAILAYRQALRDLPAQAGFPDAVTWPMAPELP